MMSPRSCSTELRNVLRRQLVHLGYHSRPRFLIIGAQKAGTTALYYYLARHPQIHTGRDKEIGFFTPETFAGLPDHPHHSILCPAGGSIYGDARAYANAAEWYHALFPLPHVLGPRGVTFEATPEYLYFPSAARRIFDYDAGMKLIVLLRDPAERAFSAWNMYHRFADPIYCRIRDPRTFEDAIQSELSEIDAQPTRLGADYVRRGIYADQLRRFFHLFGRKQVMWIDARDLRGKTTSILQRVATFLELQPFPSTDGNWEAIHVGAYDGSAPSDSMRLLRDFYRPHNRRLYELLNHDFGWA